MAGFNGEGTNKALPYGDLWIKERERVSHASPHLLADALKIAITALFPLLLIALVVYELLGGQKHIS